MKCPIDVEKKVAEMRQELHPDALVEDAYRAILGAMNGAYCDGLLASGEINHSGSGENRQF